MKVKSPVTYSNNTELVEHIQTKGIIEAYLNRKVNVEHFFRGLDSIQLFACRDTGYRFFHPDKIFGDGAFYEELQKQIENYYHANRWEHHKAAMLIPADSSVLEVGCGDGVFLSMIERKVAVAKGLELNQSAAEKARQKGLDVTNETIQDFSGKHAEMYDVVCCFQVLEHIYDIRLFLNALLKAAKPGALVIIAVPNNDPYLFQWYKDDFLNLPPHHAGWWNESSLSALEKVFPLKIQNIYKEPLNDPKTWYKAQINHYKKTKPQIAWLLKMITRPFYKTLLKAMRHRIAGQSIMAVYRKTPK